MKIMKWRLIQNLSFNCFSHLIAPAVLQPNLGFAEQISSQRKEDTKRAELSGVGAEKRI